MSDYHWIHVKVHQLTPLNLKFWKYLDSWLSVLMALKLSYLVLQLPPSCIQRAIMMASKLETLVQRRTGNRLGETLFSERLCTSGESEASDNLSDHAKMLDENDDRDMVRLSTVASKKFFRDLWSALGNNDLANRDDFLKAARSAAAELIAW